MSVSSGTLVSKTNWGQNILKNYEHIRQGSPNLVKAHSKLGTVIDISFSAKTNNKKAKNTGKSGIFAKVIFDGETAEYAMWVTVGEDYFGVLCSKGNKDAILAQSPRVEYHWKGNNRKKGVAYWVWDNKQESQCNHYESNKTTNLVGVFPGMVHGHNVPGS